jgi:hypothetical protein
MNQIIRLSYRLSDRLLAVDLKGFACDQTCADKVLRLSGWRDLKSRPLDPQIGGLMSSRAAERATMDSGVGGECRVIPY